MSTATASQSNRALRLHNNAELRRENIWWVALCVLLVAMLCGAFVMLWPDYGESGLQVSEIPEQWPTDTALSHDARLPTVVLFVESAEEDAERKIEELRNAIHTAPTKTVIVFDEAVENLRNKRLLQLAGQLPNTNIVFDENQVEARRFGAADSGAYRVYEPDGKLAHADTLTGRSDNEHKTMAAILGGHPRPTTPTSDRDASCRVE